MVESTFDELARNFARRCASVDRLGFKSGLTSRGQADTKNGGVMNFSFCHSTIPFSGVVLDIPFASSERAGSTGQGPWLGLSRLRDTPRVFPYPNIRHVLLRLWMRMEIHCALKLRVQSQKIAKTGARRLSSTAGYVWIRFDLLLPHGMACDVIRMTNKTPKSRTELRASLVDLLNTPQSSPSTSLRSAVHEMRHEIKALRRARRGWREITEIFCAGGFDRANPRVVAAYHHEPLSSSERAARKTRLQSDAADEPAKEPISSVEEVVPEPSPDAADMRNSATRGPKISRPMDDQ